MTERGSIVAAGGAVDVDDEYERLLGAFVKASSQYGYRHLTIEQVSRYSGLGQARFEAHFAGTEQALIAAQDAFFARLQGEVDAACANIPDWPQAVRTGLRAVFSSLVEASALARVFVVEAPASSPIAAEHQYAALAYFATLLHSGRRRYPRASTMPAFTERVLVGGVASVATKHLLVEDPDALAAEEPQLLQSLLAPYVGSEEAARIAGE